MEIWICFCRWNISCTESPQQIVDFSLNDLDHWGLCVVTSGLALFIVAAFYFDRTK